MVRFRTAWRVEASCGIRAFNIVLWNGTRNSPKRDNRSDSMSRDSNFTETSSYKKGLKNDLEIAHFSRVEVF